MQRMNKKFNPSFPGKWFLFYFIFAKSLKTLYWQKFPLADKKGCKMNGGGCSQKGLSLDLLRTLSSINFFNLCLRLLCSYITQKIVLIFVCINFGVFCKKISRVCCCCSYHPSVWEVLTWLFDLLRVHYLFLSYCISNRFRR